MSLRVEQAQAKQAVASGEENVPAQRHPTRVALAPTRDPNWQRLSSAAAPATGVALSTPTRGGASLRVASAPSKRVELASANAQLQARTEIAVQTLATIAPEHRAAVAAVFEHEIAAYTAYRNSIET